MGQGDAAGLGLIVTVQHIVNVSGGKDSEATYVMATRMGNRLGAWRAAFFDTGNEHELTLEHIATMQARIGGAPIETFRADFTADMARKRKYMAEHWPAKGVPQATVDRAIALLHPTGNPFLDLCMMKGRFPSTKARFCTEELKYLPAMRQLVGPALRNGPVLQWIGVRRDESLRRADTPLYRRDDLPRNMKWYPIRHWSADDVFAYLRKNGVTPNPLYRLGMKRVGCMPCIDCGKNEMRQIARRFPEHIDKIAEWESIVAAVSKRGLATFFAGDTDPLDGDDPDKKDGYADIRRVVEWSRTTRGGRQYGLDAWAEKAEPAGCSSLYGLCE